MYIRGVNLGNWLVLEKWMSPALFAGTTAEDEYSLPAQLSPEVYQARIQIHRSEYITERDFAFIRRMGLNAVRIPVPYFIFGDRPPFLGCIEDLDRAFRWAEHYGLKILIDLHTVPMSQNGFDNGGICGVCRWSQLPEEVDFVPNVLEKLAERYGHRDGLLGIEPVNEPITDAMWNLMDVPNRYPAADKELAAGSGPNSMEFLRNFYADAYARIRPHLAPGKYVVFHDGFQLNAWKDILTQSRFEDVILDTHFHLMNAEQNGCEQSVSGYLKYIEENFKKGIEEVAAYVPVVCGEWCMFNSCAAGVDTKGGQTVLNGMDFSENRETMTPTEKREIYRAITSAQLEAWRRGSGYFYWSYKLLLDTVNEPGWIGWDCWDLGKSAALGWFPMET